jgi:hypothetical protein
MKAQEISQKLGEAPIRGERGGSPLGRAPSGKNGVEYLNSCNSRKHSCIWQRASKLHPTFEMSRNVYQAG